MANLIRLARTEDAVAIAEIYRPYVEETVISFETAAPDAGEIAQRMARLAGRFAWLVYERQGRVAGYAYASPHADRAAYGWSADVAIYLDRNVHRQGAGRALYRVLIETLRLQGFHQAYGSITLPNPASVGLHEAAGFQPIAVFGEVGYKFGAWRDVGWWGLKLGAGDAGAVQGFSAEILDRALAIAAA